jgi:xanthine dehydrogenase accessory factor
MNLLDKAAQHQAKGEAFALATVVRTVSVAAAKAGAKAMIAQDGSIVEGWIGGGCARAAVLKAARQSLQDGRSRLVSITPQELLADLGVAPGEDRAGVLYARNSCPSQGTMDVFVEPILPKPMLLVLGASPVAVAVAKLAGDMGFAVTAAATAEEFARFGPLAQSITGYDLPATTARDLFVVVSTQGTGDRAALTAATKMDAIYAAFVGSKRKATKLRDELAGEGIDRMRLDAIKAPAGLDISAITTEEIALSIVGEMIAVRRVSQRARA